MDVIKVITGLRRSGKLTIMRQVQEYYKRLIPLEKAEDFKSSAFPRSLFQSKKYISIHR